MPLEKTTLPPGWEAKIDKKTGKTYYVNHYEKNTTWDHPCNSKKFNAKTNGYPKHAGGDYIALQHGSPDVKRNYVYPSQPSPIPAFQVSPHESPKINLFQDFSSRNRGSPLTVRSNTQESPLWSNSGNTDEAVSKIAAMFPTVSETHIRLLMKKYMKSIFPQAEETMILEILSNHDHNIQKTSEKLREMGYEKKDSLKISQQKYQAQVRAQEDKEQTPQSGSVIPIQKTKTEDEKRKVKSELQDENKNIPEQLITMALESVNFDKEKASNLLKGISLDGTKSEEGKIVEFSQVDNQAINKSVDVVLPVSMSRQSLKSLLKSEKTEKEKIKICRGVDSSYSGYKSKNLSNVMGPNPALAKGNKENLLLEDYIKWQGPDHNHRKGAKPGLANGPNASNKIDNRVGANGPKSDNFKGPNKNLVKGSIYNQIKATVGVREESRGK
ncbi:uncharacterized protein LOC123672447 isoform X4 [Harmonia axyridis]|uniref:uncharacterized protein LOC123672447 isoform X4 n=1 Tax=Harmonia axyridis TaxID=115357 RepID=UPI001E275172|nr:uncharacterized protein LOC123672447 isoform X4 [Harmonia axyridis]